MNVKWLLQVVFCVQEIILKKLMWNKLGKSVKACLTEKVKCRENKIISTIQIPNRKTLSEHGG